jgi:RNA polymerase sigma-70 factor (ECF subfamily)
VTTALPDGYEERTDAGVSVDDEVIARRLAEALEAALLRLPETQREAFTLLRGEGLATSEAAARLGISVNALKLRAFRAYEVLRATSHEEGVAA